jgi:hypothetical protein
VIDDVRVYNRALSDDEVSQLYSLEGGSAVPEPSTYFSGLLTLGMLGLSFWKHRKYSLGAGSKDRIASGG